MQITDDENNSLTIEDIPNNAYISLILNIEIWSTKIEISEKSIFIFDFRRISLLPLSFYFSKSNDRLVGKCEGYCFVSCWQ